MKSRKKEWHKWFALHPAIKLVKQKTTVVQDWKHSTSLIGEPTTMLRELLKGHLMLDEVSNVVKTFPDDKFPIGSTVTIKLEVEIILKEGE